MQLKVPLGSLVGWWDVEQVDGGEWDGERSGLWDFEKETVKLLWANQAQKPGSPYGKY